MIAPDYETLNFAGKPISNGGLPKNFLTTFLGSAVYSNDYTSFQGSASDEYVVISPYRNYESNKFVDRVIDGGAGADVAFLAQNSFNISSIKTNSLGIAKVETLDTVLFLLNTEALDTVDKQYALPSSTINYTSSSQQNSEGYVVDINGKGVSPGSDRSTYLLPTNGNDFRSFTGNYLWNVDAGLGSDTFLITDRKSADIKTWTYADNTWYLYLGNGNYTFKNLENIIFRDTGFRLNSDGTKSELPFTDLKSSGQVLVVNNGAANFSITGTPAVGQILTAAATSKDPDGDGTFSYQWQSSADGGASWVALAAANASTYTVAAADAGKTIRALISYKDLKGFQESVTATPVAIPIVNNGTASFSITGTPAVGQILTAAATSKDPDGDGTFSYQWQSSADGGSSWVAIAAANASTYTVASAENSKRLRSVISYKDQKGFAEVVTTQPVSISSGAANTPSTTGNNSPTTTVSNGSGTTIINNITNNITNNTINSNNTTTNNINNSINITGSFNGNTSAKALAGSLKLEDPDTKQALPVNGDSAVKTLAQLTAAKPLSDTAKQLLDRYIIKDPSSSSSRKASASDAGFIDFTLKTGSLKSLTAEIDLASEVKATAYVKVNPNTGEAYDFTYDPVTGLGAELLDTNKNGLVDSLRIHLQDGGLGDVDGAVNGSIRDPGVLAEAPRLPVYRFFRNGVHFYTTNSSERDSVIANSYGKGVGFADLSANPQAKDPITGGWGYRYEGVAYQALDTQGTALYRFYSPSKGYHFVTTNADEALTVIQNSVGSSYNFSNAKGQKLLDKGWGFQYEETSYKVSTIAQTGMDTPVYRFYNQQKAVHFYSSSMEEAKSVIAKSLGAQYATDDWIASTADAIKRNSPYTSPTPLASGWGYQFEGVGWYV